MEPEMGECWYCKRSLCSCADHEDARRITELRRQVDRSLYKLLCADVDVGIAAIKQAVSEAIDWFEASDDSMLADLLRQLRIMSNESG